MSLSRFSSHLNIPIIDLIANHISNDNIMLFFKKSKYFCQSFYIFVNFNGFNGGFLHSSTCVLQFFSYISDYISVKN